MRPLSHRSKSESEFFLEFFFYYKSETEMMRLLRFKNSCETSADNAPFRCMFTVLLTYKVSGGKKTLNATNFYFLFIFSTKKIKF
jgi:hypothetical protein